MTVGGFYAHFSSKEELAREAVGKAMADRRLMFLERSDQHDWASRLCSAFAAYFAEEHRDDAEGRCPIPMAAIDAARNGTAASSFVEQFTEMASAFQNGRDAADPPAPREAALGSLALMVGGMILARATEGTELSDEILRAAKDFGDAALGGLA